MNANGYIDDGFQAEREQHRAVTALMQFKSDLREVELERDIILLGIEQLKKKYSKNNELITDIDNIIRVSKITINI